MPHDEPRRGAPALTCGLLHLLRALGLPGSRAQLHQGRHILWLGGSGSAVFQRPRSMPLGVTVTQDLPLKVIFQGINRLFKKQEDVLFLVCEVLQALIVLYKRFRREEQDKANGGFTEGEKPTATQGSVQKPGWKSFPTWEVYTFLPGECTTQVTALAQPCLCVPHH